MKDLKVLMITNDNRLEWRTAEVDKNGKLRSGMVWNANQMIATNKSLKGKYVICKDCHEVLRNTKQAKAKHINQYGNLSACSSCQYCRDLFVGGNEPIVKRVGDYFKVTNTMIKYCIKQYYDGYGPRKNYNVVFEEIHENCPKKCHRGFAPYGDMFFDRYPNAFDIAITVDTLIENRFVLSTDSVFKCQDNWYELKGKNLFAHCSKEGIVTQFAHRYRKHTTNFMYSKKYDKAFWNEYEMTPWKVPTEKWKQVLSMVRELYK